MFKVCSKYDVFIKKKLNKEKTAQGRRKVEKKDPLCYLRKVAHKRVINNNKYGSAYAVM